MDDFEKAVAPYRRELRAHCYRMSGSLLDADDLLQESLIKAWKGFGSFEGRSSLRTWLYAVATHACIDAMEKKSARLLPADLGPANRPLGDPKNEPIWLEPAPSELAQVELSTEPSPEARYSQRESSALAFLAALQLLPARQRAVLILRDVLGWQASECAERLEMSVAAVNSALQRARETLEKRSLHSSNAADPELLRRYVHAWESADINELVALLHEEATLAMPPFAEWLMGAQIIGQAIAAMVFSTGAKYRMIPVEANGLPAFASYRDGQPAGIHVLEIVDGKVRAMTAFLDPRLVGAFGLNAPA